MSSFATLVYNNSAMGVNAVNTALTAAVDDEFTQQGGSYQFTEDYYLGAAAFVETSGIRARFQAPSWNAWGEFTIFNSNRSLQPPSNAQWDLYLGWNLLIPQVEQFAVNASNNLGASTEIGNVVLQVMPKSWNANLPRAGGMAPAIFPLRASFTVTPTLNAWSAVQAITLSQALRAGAYAIVGTVVQGTNAVAWRWAFPRPPIYTQGGLSRKMRPGGLITNAVGDVVCNQLDPWLFRFGEYGRFHTFELPQIQVFGTLAGSITYQVFMWCVYLGPSPSDIAYPQMSA